MLTNTFFATASSPGPYDIFDSPSYKFKEGDVVILKKSCTGCHTEIKYRLIYNIFGELIARNELTKPGEGCTCLHNYILVPDEKRTLKKLNSY